MKKIIALVVITGLLALVGAKLWHSQRSSNEPEVFWQANNETSELTIDHSQWQEVLDEFLISDSPIGVNLVDYDSLQSEAEMLNAYLGDMTQLDPRNYNRQEQFAYWVNLYNALTLKVIIDHYPVESIRKISSSGLPIGPWDDEVATIAGRAVTLNIIEHRILRAFWDDHRIHFAVNCASIGCPDVQEEAFTAANTESLLESAARDYLQHPRGLTFNEDRIVLSSIFKWYKEDFGNTQDEVLKTLAQYLEDEQRSQLLTRGKKIEYDYDWSLNDSEG